MDNLVKKKANWHFQSQNEKKKKALHVDKAIFCMKRKIRQLQDEIY